MENYNDKAKLSANVFEDFENQTAWQSFTTLLITDIVGNEVDEHNPRTLSKTASNNLLGGK